MHRNTKLLILVVGSNALTFCYTAALAGKLLKKDKEAYDKLWRIAKVHHKAVLLFTANAPREVSKKVLEEIQFDWVVRDLDDPAFEDLAPGKKR